MKRLKFVKHLSRVFLVILLLMLLINENQTMILSKYDEDELIIGDKIAFNYIADQHWEDIGNDEGGDSYVYEVKKLFYKKINITEDTEVVFKIKSNDSSFDFVIGKKFIEKVDYYQPSNVEDVVFGVDHYLYNENKTSDGSFETSVNLSKGTYYLYLKFNKSIGCKFTVKGDYYIGLNKITLNKTGSTHTSVSLKWEELDNVDKYQIYYSTNKDSGYKKYGTYDANTLKQKVTGLKTGNTYYFKVRGYKIIDTKNVYTDFSNIIKVHLILNQPKNLYVAKNTYNSVKVSWDKSTGASYYELFERKDEYGTWKKINVFYKDLNEKIVSSLDTGTYYYFKVRARKDVGNDTVYSSYSNVDYAKPELSKPTVTVTKKSSTSIKVSWKKISGSNGYQLYRSVDSGAYKKIKTLGRSSLSYINTSLIKGKTYGYKVRAYRNVGEKKVYSSFSNPVKKKI